MIDRIDITEADCERIGVLQSPSYDAPPPNVFDIDLIPDRFHKAMSKAWYARTVHESSVTVDRVSDVFMTNEGLIFTKDLKVIEQTRTQHSEADILAGAERLRYGSEIAEISEESLLMRKRGESNYGHWLIEILPKLNIASRFIDAACLVIPNAQGLMKEVIRDSLAMVSPTHPKIVPKGASSVSHFRSLVIVDGLTSHGTFMSPLVFSDISRMLDKAGGGGLKRLYVARPGSSRSISNEYELLELLGQKGFQVIDPGSMSFTQQVSAFKSAEIVIGVMGAAMTNIMFCPRGCKVINIAPANFPDTFFYLISCLRGLVYNEIRGKNDDESDSRNVPFRIDLKKLVICLENLL